MHLTFSGTRKRIFSVRPIIVAVQKFTRLVVNTMKIVNPTKRLTQDTERPCNIECVKIPFLVLEANKKKNNFSYKLLYTFITQYWKFRFI